MDELTKMKRIEIVVTEEVLHQVGKFMTFVDMCQGKDAIECNPINMFCGRILWALHHDKDVIWLDKQALEPK